jgi:hypothetical protein
MARSFLTALVAGGGMDVILIVIVIHLHVA